ncbi:hypothetical protein [Coleofasciculus sp. G2-EDA-02]
MAQLFPSEANISKLKVKPTKGERCLLDCLKETLDKDDDLKYTIKLF